MPEVRSTPISLRCWALSVSPVCCVHCASVCVRVLWNICKASRQPWTMCVCRDKSLNRNFDEPNEVKYKWQCELRCKPDTHTHSRTRARRQSGEREKGIVGHMASAINCVFKNHVMLNGAENMCTQSLSSSTCWDFSLIRRIDFFFRLYWCACVFLSVRIGDVSIRYMPIFDALGVFSPLNVSFQSLCQ